ncbi:unnamed protein product [Hydatigera taeniaeformis]|uniref:Methyltranfer_dom domain-containing protein n=1 Tax=Hydatigena taeniaeformis TaxID=6205 RepID=A0A0R3XA99_HYDTA|nr:unnamed protein product [Hydatigera taeniaeformis]
MNSILPKTIDEFGSSDYWNNFFAQRSTTFEWYGDFFTLAEIFIQNIKKSDSVLEVGCGNSVLSADIYDKVGCATYLGIDYSQEAIEQSQHLVSPSRPNLRFELADVFTLSSDLNRLGLTNKEFNCVVDKGTFDAIDNGQANVDVNQYFGEIASTLSLFGRYILITLAQDHVVKHIADYFLDRDSQWIVSCYQVTNPEERSADSTSLPLFTFVMTKMRPSSVLPQLRLKTYGDDQPCCCIQEDLKQRLADWIKYHQISCILSQSQTKSKCGREFEIIHSKSGVVIFVCRIAFADSVTGPTSGMKHHPKAVFLVPQVDAEAYVPPEAAQPLLESMGHLKCALLAFPHPALRFISLEAAKASLSDGLVASPLAAAVRNIYRFISDEVFSEPSSILLLVWINVSRRFAGVLGQDGAKFIYYGVPPCLHKAVMEFLHVHILADDLKTLIQELYPAVHFQVELNEGCAFMCYDQPSESSEESLLEFLHAAEKSLIPQGICCILSRSTPINNTPTLDRVSQIEQNCGPSLKLLLTQDCGAASIYVIYKKKHKVSKSKFAARLHHIAQDESTVESAIPLSNKLRGVEGWLVAEYNLIFEIFSK